MFYLRRFLKTLGGILSKHGHLLYTFHQDLMSKTAEMYSEAIRSKGSPLSSCIGFTDFPKIQMHRQDKPNDNRRAIYSSTSGFTTSFTKLLQHLMGSYFICTVWKLVGVTILLWNVKAEYIKTCGIHCTWTIWNSIFIESCGYLATLVADCS